MRLPYESTHLQNDILDRDNAHRMEFLTTIRYFDLMIKPQSRILDVSAGSGRYSFYLAEKGHKVTAGDLVEKHVSQMLEKQHNNGIDMEIYQGNANDLSRFKNDSFDVVLFMGPYYHLLDEVERIKAIKESLRVLKKCGLLFWSYLNRIPMFLVEIIRRNRVVNEKFFDDVINKGILTESKESVFYFSKPDEIEIQIKCLAAEKLKNISVDGICYLIKDRLNNMSKNEFNDWMRYHYYTCEDPDLLGYGLHGLMICRKI